MTQFFFLMWVQKQSVLMSTNKGLIFQSLRVTHLNSLPLQSSWPPADWDKNWEKNIPPHSHYKCLFDFIILILTFHISQNH